MTRSSRDRGTASVVWVVSAIAGFAGAIGVIGADALWLVPLGGRLAHGQLPHSIPYATAPSGDWHDVPAGAEIVFWTLFHVFGGVRGLALAQAAGAAIGFAFLARGLRRESSDGPTLLVALLVLAGALPSVVVTNASVFSLALFPALLALLESDSRTPGRRIWFCVPILALWGNLHGEALAGWALVAVYLLFERGRHRPRSAAAILVAATGALFLNPTLWETPRYYLSVFNSEVAQRGSGLWAPLGTDALDLLLVAVAASLLAVSLVGPRRIRLWEAVALLGLAVATYHVARSGTWFLFVAAYPAARSLQFRAPRKGRLIVVAAGFTAAAAALLVVGPADPGSDSLAALAARSGRTVLAEAVLGQQVALAGGRVWMDNPIDAFRNTDQSLYLDWLAGRPDGEKALSHAGYVLVIAGSGPGKLAAHDPRLVRVAADRRAALYRVRAG